MLGEKKYYVTAAQCKPDLTTSYGLLIIVPVTVTVNQPPFCVIYYIFMQLEHRSLAFNTIRLSI